MKLIIPTGRKVSTFDTQVNACSCNCACSISGQSQYSSTYNGGVVGAQYNATDCACQCSYGSANQNANSNMARY